MHGEICIFDQRGTCEALDGLEMIVSDVGVFLDTLVTHFEFFFSGMLDFFFDLTKKNFKF